jgi:hypothetical protein
MANAILTKLDARATFTITLDSQTTGTTRQSTLVSNSSNRPAAIVKVKWTSGTSPTLNSTVPVYLIRSDGTNASDGAGASDAALTQYNSQLLGWIVVGTATSNTTFIADFDTAPLGPLGTSWGIAVKNSSAVTSNTTAGNFAASYEYYYPEVQ